MNVFESLADLYAEIDAHYMAQELQESAAGDVQSEAAIASKRRLNDHAYFLFMFTRFEDFVREESSKLIRQNCDTRLDWTHRRVWQLLPSGKGDDYPSFLNRVALLIDKSTDHYRDIQDYHKQRNTIAHGGDFTIPLSVPTIFNNFSHYLTLINSGAG